MRTTPQDCGMASNLPAHWSRWAACNMIWHGLEPKWLRTPSLRNGMTVFFFFFFFFQQAQCPDEIYCMKWRANAHYPTGLRNGI
mmetsp:Transcript_15478/g.12402  ORF Transcript_15478/g.12402 Transcript_15478/m.12402 type:complete len:84 (+) Transcript_15478:73-324(+)